MLRRALKHLDKSTSPYAVSSFSPTAVTLTAKERTTTATLPLSWILRNPREVRHATGQRTETLRDVIDSSPTKETISAAEWSNNHLTVTLASGKTLTVAGDDVAKYGLKPSLREVTPLLGRGPASVSFEQATLFTRSGDASAAAIRDIPSQLPALVEALIRDGICIIDDCPNTDDSIHAIAKALNPPLGVMHTLYATSWKVAAEPALNEKIRNIAYTGSFLDLHNDLAYYESMPGLQLLHCQRFEPEVSGGESFFVDAFGAAQQLRAEDREAFDTLCRVPAAFMKDDPGRLVPAQYYLSAPHISLSHEGVIRKVVWAPAFEAPLPLELGAETIDRYYGAYAKFAKILETWKFEKQSPLRFKLRPGQCVVFNQTRVLHGREAFSEPKPGMRRLHGGYVNIDDFRNRAASVVHDRSLLELPVGNGSWW